MISVLIIQMNFRTPHSNMVHSALIMIRVIRRRASTWPFEKMIKFRRCLGGLRLSSVSYQIFYNSPTSKTEFKVYMRSDGPSVQSDECTYQGIQLLRELFHTSLRPHPMSSCIAESSRFLDIAAKKKKSMYQVARKIVSFIPKVHDDQMWDVPAKPPALIQNVLIWSQRPGRLCL